MSLAMINPTPHQRTAQDRTVKEAEVLFPFPDDTGLDIKDLLIVIVYNDLHHYVGTKHPQPTFNDGVSEIVQHLQQIRLLCDNMPVQDERVKEIMSATSKTAAATAYNIERLFKPSEISVPAAEGAQAAEPLAKKMRLDGSAEVIEHKSKMTRDGTTSTTTLHCDCGVRKNSSEGLEAYKLKYHKGESGKWRCAYTGCNKEFKFGKSCRKHVRNDHLGEYLYWCKYCTNYGKDQRHLVINHMYTKHGMGIQIPCKNLGCDKMFPSEVSLKNHERYYTCIVYLQLLWKKI